jgi:hypothetical protein
MPIIHGGFSFSKGLNTILEKHLSKNQTGDEPTFQKLIALQDVIGVNKLSQININVKKEYKSELSKNLFNVYCKIIENSLQKHNIKNAGTIKSKLHNAIKYQAIVYSGGGAFYDEIKPKSVGFFNDIRVIDASVMGYRSTLLNDTSKVEKLFPILANSYGLSNPLINEVEIIPFHELEVWSTLKEIDTEERKGFERYDCSDD